MPKPGWTCRIEKLFTIRGYAAAWVMPCEELRLRFRNSMRCLAARRAVASRRGSRTRDELLAQAAPGGARNCEPASARRSMRDLRAAAAPGGAAIASQHA